MSVNWSLKTTWSGFSGINYLAKSSVGMVGGTNQVVAVLNLETGQYGSSYEIESGQTLYRIANTANNIFCLTAQNTSTLHKLDPVTFDSVGSYQAPGLSDFAVNDGRLYTLLCNHASSTVQELDPSTLDYISTAQMTAGTYGRVVSKSGTVAAYSTDYKNTNLAAFTQDLSQTYGTAVIKNDIPALFQADPFGQIFIGFGKSKGIFSYGLSPFQQQGAWSQCPLNSPDNPSELHFLGNEIFLSAQSACYVLQNNVQLSLKGQLPGSISTYAIGATSDNQLLCATFNGLQIYSKGD